MTKLCLREDHNAAPLLDQIIYLQDLRIFSRGCVNSSKSDVTLIPDTWRSPLNRPEYRKDQVIERGAFEWNNTVFTEDSLESQTAMSATGPLTKSQKIV